MFSNGNLLFIHPLPVLDGLNFNHTFFFEKNIDNTIIAEAIFVISSEMAVQFDTDNGVLLDKREYLREALSNMFRKSSRVFLRASQNVELFCRHRIL